MPMRMDVREVSWTLVVRPATSATPPAAVRPRQVIDVDVRQQVLGARGGARAREAAARYADHGTGLLGHVQAHGSAAQAGPHDAADGWTVVGRWLTFVAVLSVFAVAFALYGGHALR